MIKAADLLPPVQSYPQGLPVYFLTGKNYLYQTLFCIASLQKASPQQFKYILVDDGSFNMELITKVARQLPGADVITVSEIEKQLDLLLPVAQFPTLRQKRLVYPHLKKLTDVHVLPGSQWKLVMDSDMLFWQQPEEMITWLQSPRHPIHMIDCVESYGYTMQLMEALCSAAIPKLLNVGVIGLKSDDINWHEIERWIKELEEHEGASYYLEQALTAMLIGNNKATILDKNAYIVNPHDLNEGAVLHHYVDLSKKVYFTKAWKSFLPVQ